MWYIWHSILLCTLNLYMLSFLHEKSCLGHLYNYAQIYVCCIFVLNMESHLQDICTIMHKFMYGYFLTCHFLDICTIIHLWMLHILFTHGKSYLGCFLLYLKLVCVFFPPFWMEWHLLNILGYYTLNLYASTFSCFTWQVISWTFSIVHLEFVFFLLHGDSSLGHLSCASFFPYSWKVISSFFNSS